MITKEESKKVLKKREVYHKLYMKKQNMVPESVLRAQEARRNS